MKPKIKVLHICQAPIGGTVEYLRLFFTNYSKNKYEHILICPKDGNINEIIGKLDIEIMNINMTREIDLIKDIKSILTIRNELKKINPDIIYLHSSKAGALGRIANLFSKIPVVYNPHGWAFTMEGSKLKRIVYALIERILYVFTNKIINISKDEIEVSKIYGFNQNKMILIENGINTEKYKHNIKEIFIDKFVIGFVGRLSEQKNPFFLIDLAKELKIEISNLLLYIVGDGEYKENLLRKIESENLEEYFYFSGWSTQVEKEMKNFDIGIVPSKWEGFGLVVCEYMASEKLVISSGVGGMKDIIQNNENGFIVDKMDLNKTKALILNIYNKKIDVEKIIKKAKADVLSKYSIERVIKEHERLFEELLNWKGNR